MFFQVPFSGFLYVSKYLSGSDLIKAQGLPINKDFFFPPQFEEFVPYGVVHEHRGYLCSVDKKPEKERNRLCALIYALPTKISGGLILTECQQTNKNSKKTWYIFQRACLVRILSY